MSAEKIREVRERSGAPMNECKSALDETSGDVEKALEVLQKRGATRSVSGQRIAAEGLVHSYIHTGGRLAVLVEINCETDFVARTPEFRQFCEDVAMQIAGMNAKYVSRDEIPEADLVKQRGIFEDQVRKDGKPAAALPKIVEGKLNKWFTEVCLLDQESVLVPHTSIEKVRAQVSSNFREKVTIRRFARWEVGEGLTKRSNDLAAEVAKTIEDASVKS